MRIVLHKSIKHRFDFRLWGGHFYILPAVDKQKDKKYRHFGIAWLTIGIAISLAK